MPAKKLLLPKPIANHIQYLERVRQDFVANVSHELRTPLTVVHGYLEVLLEQETDETKQWKKIFQQMQQQTKRMEDLIEDLLLLARLENEVDESEQSQRVNVPALLELIQQEAQSLSNEAAHKIQLRANQKLQLLGREEELRSLFSNLIFNAVKYTPAGKEIDIEWYEDQGQAYFKVIDQGIGIAPEHIPRLTERFYRVDPARSRASGGTGLGLAIAKHVLLRHQAKFFISSKLGKGSVFICVFPKERVRIA